MRIDDQRAKIEYDTGFREWLSRWRAILIDSNQSRFHQNAILRDTGTTHQGDTRSGGIQQYPHAIRGLVERIGDGNEYSVVSGGGNGEVGFRQVPYASSREQVEEPQKSLCSVRE